MQREITRELVRRLLPGRMAESNKGSYGSVLAAAGSMAYRGAAALCTEGALRGGAGLVYLASVEPVIQLVRRAAPLVRGQARRFAGRARVGGERRRCL